MRIIFQLAIVTLLTISSSNVFSQKLTEADTELSVEEIQDSIMEAKMDSIHESIDERFDSLEEITHFEVGIDASSRAIYLGREFGPGGNNQFLFNPNISFHHKSGFNIGLVNYNWNGNLYDNALTDIIIGYAHPITKWWDFSLDYVYWIFHEDFPDYLDWHQLVDCSNEFNIADVINLKADFVYMFGADYGFVVQNAISKKIYLYPFENNNNRLTIEPEIGIYYGDENIYNQKNISINQDLTNIGLLDYYASLKVTYQFKTWAFGIGGELNYPQASEAFSADQNKPIGSLSIQLKKYIPIHNHKSKTKSL
jgi:hypothetical protein